MGLTDLFANKLDERAICLNSVIFAHQNHEMFCDRLEPTLYLLQRLALPIRYRYIIENQSLFSQEIKDAIFTLRLEQFIERVHSITGDSFRSKINLVELEHPLLLVLMKRGTEILQCAASYEILRSQYHGIGKSEKKSACFCKIKHPTSTKTAAFHLLQRLQLIS